jgi:hypothetical protein
MRIALNFKLFTIDTFSHVAALEICRRRAIARWVANHNIPQPGTSVRLFRLILAAKITGAAIPFRKKALATKLPKAVNLGGPAGQYGRRRIRLEETVNESGLKITSPRSRFLTRMKNRRFT